MREIVNTMQSYPYDVMERDIHSLEERYPFLEIGIAGKSVLGRNLYYLRLGTGPNHVFYNGAHHALEWLTALLLMKFSENYLESYISNTLLGRCDIQSQWQKSSIYILPMVNPDGVDLVLNGLQPDHPYNQSLLKWNNGRTNFSQVWQANIHGVDLNHNYDASWQLSKGAEASHDIKGPGPTRFSGASPESEPESKAVADFTRKHDFQLVLAFHSQGRIIYWNYRNLASTRDKEIARCLSRLSGYTLEEAVGMTSYAGYKDWFIEKFRRPGYTIEIGQGQNPLPISQLGQIYQENEGLLLTAAQLT